MCVTWTYFQELFATKMDDDLFAEYEEREENTRQLAEDELEMQQEIDEEEENEDPSRVCWANLANDDRRCKILSGFTCDEFLELYDIVEGSIRENIGRGRQSKVSKLDRFLVTLCYLKHYETLDKLKDTFALSKTCLYNLLETTINAISPVLYNHFVVNLDDRLDEDDEDIQVNFPEAKFVMDATFHPIWTPAGTFNEKKRYFSGKHKMYGLKSQCLHDRKGRVVHCVPGEPGATHDFTLCRNHLDEVHFH